MLLIASPICPLCRRFQPIVRVAAEFSANEKLPVNWFWFDHIRNDFPPTTPAWATTPALFYYGQGANYSTPVTYQGGYDLTQVLEFLRNNSRLEFKIPEWDWQDLNDILGKHYNEFQPPKGFR